MAREAVHEVLQEVRDLGLRQLAHALLARLRRLREVLVAGAQLFQALQVRAQLVGRVHQIPRLVLVVLREEQWLVRVAQRLGQHAVQALARDLLDLRVCLTNLRVEVLDRRHDVAGDDLAGVVEERQRRRTLGVHPAAEVRVADHAQRVRDQRHLQAVLEQVLDVGVAHQAPAGHEAHLRQVGEEVAHHGILARVHRSSRALTGRTARAGGR
jgi:hypothetical protein